MDMNEALAKLKTAIIDDYRGFGSGSYHDGQIAKMESGEILTHTEGKKYIRIVSGGSAWGFVVNCHDDAKFKYGDILKTASWATPARNQARGNVFGEYKINWTGPNYLK